MRERLLAPWFWHTAGLFGVSLMLCFVAALDANFDGARRRAADGVRVLATLERGMGEAEVSGIVSSIESQEDVKSAGLRNAAADQAAVFAQEPWAQPYKDALATNFLPQVVEILPRNVYATGVLDRIEAHLKGLKHVTSVVYDRAGFEKSQNTFQTIAWLLRFLTGAAAICFLAGAGALEAMRNRADLARAFSSGEAEFTFRDRWLGRVATSLVSIGLALGATIGAMLFVGAKTAARFDMLPNAYLIVLASAGALLPFSLSWLFSRRGTATAGRKSSVAAATRPPLQFGRKARINLLNAQPVPRKSPRAAKVAESRDLDADLARARDAYKQTAQRHTT